MNSKITDTRLGICYFSCQMLTRTNSSGSVRWTLPATSANTGCYYNFALTEQNAYRVQQGESKRCPTAGGRCREGSEWQRSVCNVAALSARRTPGTATVAYLFADKIFSTSEKRVQQGELTKKDFTKVKSFF